MRNSIWHILTIWLTVTFSILASNAFSQADQQLDPESTATDKPAYVRGLTSGRARSLVGGVVALVSLVIGWRVKRRASGSAGNERSWAMAALALAFVAIILSVVHLAGNTGGFGTGGGKAGAIVALVLGLAGLVLNGLALRRSNNVTTE